MSKKTKKDSVYVGVWHLDGDDPVVFVSRTQAGLDDQVYEAISDGFEDIVGREPDPKKKSKEIGTYFQACSDQMIDEWLLETVEEIK